MEIKYQILLNNNPEIGEPGDFIFKLQPISIEEIVSLENTLNNGNPFPAALRELLYLAGKYCYVLDYSTFGSQMEFQTQTRTWLTKHGRNFSIIRPYFVLDGYAYGDNFAFVFLDEGVDDPIVYSAELSNYDGEEPWPVNTGLRLTQLINQRIARLKSGGNPF